MKINLPINWDKILIISSSVIVTLFTLALISHSRTLAILGDLFIVMTLIVFLVLGTIAIIKKFSNKL